MIETMGETTFRFSGLLLVLAMLTVGCTSDGQGRAASEESSSPPVQTSSGPDSGGSDGAFAEDCPVTQGSRFRPPPGVSPDKLFGSESSYGNGRLWVGGLASNGVVVADFVEQDDAIGTKFGWWRQVSGRLTITGRRLDAPAPALRSQVPSGYGMTGFQTSAVNFPTEGCWEVTGEVGATTLTFVTVVKERVT
jgi:hypothetical protein